MIPKPSPQEREAFYAAAIFGLRALDARDPSPRRLGPEGSSRWEQFAGALGAADRIDLLLRDASFAWGAGFSPSEAFGFQNLADDEPFGPEWPGLDDERARRSLKENAEPLGLDQLAKILGIAPLPVALPAISPSTRLAVAGGAALLAVGKAFQTDASLSWQDQVVVVANRPAYRQLASLVAIVIGADRPARLARPVDPPAKALRDIGFGHVDVAIASEDAEAEALAFVDALGG